MSRARSPRLLIIGLDGAGFSLVNQWLRDGALPHLACLLEHGCLLPCHSTLPAHSAPAWTTMLTGCNPGAHGVFDFLRLAMPMRTPWWSVPRPPVSLFRRLSDAGLSCGALNIPVTYPAEDLNGVMVSGIGAPGLPPQAFHPRSLQEELLAEVPDYSLYPHIEPGLWPATDVLIRHARARGRAAEHVLKTWPADVFMVAFGSLDWAGHGHACAGSGSGSPLQTVAEELDAQVGRLVALTDWPQTPVLIVSDHGIACARRQVNLIEVFRRLGFLRIAKGAAPRGLGAKAVPLVVRGWHLAKRLLPSPLIAWLRGRGHRHRKALLEAAPSVAIDWEATIAAPVGAFGCVRLNVAGRDPKGIVAPADYFATRENVIRDLRALKDPATGQPIFGAVLSRDDIYRGPMIEEAPDILLRPSAVDMAFGGATTEGDLFPFIHQPGLVGPLVPSCGVHAPTGILLLSGEAAAREPDHTDCGLADVAPTILHLLGLPVPSYMDGRVLRGALSGEARSRAPMIRQEELAAPARRFVPSPVLSAELVHRL